MQKDPAYGPPQLRALGSGESPWLTTQKAPPAAPQPATPQSTEDKQLKALMTALKKHTAALPAEVQALVNDANIKDSQSETRQLHSAVAAHGRAKKELQQAQLARFNLHAAWRGFLSQAIELWRGYSNQFIEQEKQLTERVAVAQEALATARTHLTRTQESAGVEVKEDAMHISDEETDKTNKDATTNASDQIQQGLAGLRDSLDALKKSADKAAEEEQQALKRPRIESKEAPGPGGYPEVSRPFS